MAPIRHSNKNGFPLLENNTVNLTTTALTYSFSVIPFYNGSFYGGIFFKLTGTPSAPSSAVPVQFQFAGNNNVIPVYDANGVALTTADIKDSIVLGFYDKDNNQLRIIS